MKSAVQWFNDEISIHLDFDQRLYLKELLLQAKEIEKQQIIDAYASAVMKENNSDYIGMHEQSSGEIYFNETYVSKGSDDHIVEANEMVDQVPDVRKMVSYTKQDVIDAINRMYDIFMDDTLEAKKLRLKGVSWHIQNILESIKEKLAKTSSQTEISDEEIEEAVNNPNNDGYSFREGAKWYREQLKQL